MNEFIESINLWGPGVLAMSVLILASGFFSGSETSFFYLSHDEIRSMRVGKPRERLVVTLLSKPDSLLTAVLFWNLVINLAYFAISIVVAQKLNNADLSLTAAIFGLFSLFAIILFGEVLPKSIAVIARRQVATTASWPLAASIRVLVPIIPYLTSLTTVLRRMFWPRITKEAVIRAEDLERAVDAFQMSEEIIDSEQQVLHNILDLSEIKVEEVMRPRGTYETVTSPFELDKLGQQVPPGDFVVINSKGSREEQNQLLPLGNFSNITEQNFASASDDFLFVPWCSHLAYTLQLLRDNYSTAAAVVNEYGEIVGVITYEDIIDTMLVPAASRTRRLLQREPILKVDTDLYHIEGLTTLRFFSNHFGLDLHSTSEGQVTLAGMMAEQLERLPEVGDVTSWEGFQFKVIDVSQRGQLRLMVSRDQQQIN